MRIPYLDLAIRNKDLRQEVLDAIDRVLSHGRLVLGPEVLRLEEAFAERCGVRYAVGVGSGTDALYLALRSLGIGPGDEVITTCFSFIATANAVAVTGAQPVFVDIGPRLNLDPRRIEAAITKRTRAIVPVHIAGTVCDMAPIRAIAERFGLNVVEDAAQAFGASRDGIPAGAFGRSAAFSLNPMKILGGCGEGGMVVTDDEAIFRELRALRFQGMKKNGHSSIPSLNARLDTVQAAVVLAKLRRVDLEIERRRALAAFYTARIGDVVGTPVQDGNAYDVFSTYNISTERRDELMAHLERAGIETKAYYDRLMPDHEAYANDVAHLPLGRRAAETTLCLPLHGGLTDAQGQEVVDAVRAFFDSAKSCEAS